MIKKIISFVKSKVFPFVSKNWKYLLVVPFFCIIYRWIKNRKRVEERQPNTIKDDMSLKDDIRKIENQESSDLKKIEQQACDEKKGIDNGNPTPAQIFDREIKK